MIAFLIGLIGALVTWLVSVLPVSPFANLQIQTSGVADFIGWLNWVVPIGDCLTMLTVWLAAAVIWRVAKFVLTRFMGGLKLIGVGSK